MLTHIAGLFILAVAALAATRPQSLPLTFEPNLGQADRKIAFLARGSGYALHFDGAGVSVVRGRNVVRMTFPGSNTAPRVTGYQLQNGKANYLIGSPDRWITDVPLYEGVQYTDVYPGVGIAFYSRAGELEYDFSLAPGAQASKIRLTFEGVDEMRIEGGDLVLKSGWGELRHRKPRIYQMRNGNRSEIKGRFVLRGPKEAGFETGPYDTGNTLVIDPVMAYSTYIGGTGADSAWAVAVDSAGSAYVVGETWPVNFPKTFTISNSSGNVDAFIIKLNPSGTGVLYATYFGGNSRDSARGVAVDSAGNAYVTGFTYSPDFPATAGAYRSPSLGQADVFAIKVNASGSALVYSALIGGAGSDFATGIAIDPSGSAYIAGYTSSVGFPVTSGGFQKSFGGGFQDAFVTKLNSSGSGLVYSTYLGGAGSDVANGIAVDAAGEAYIAGYTDSANFPTRNPIYANAGGQGDAFVAKLTPAGDSLAFSTYLGGSLVDTATAVALDSSGSVYVTGATLSANFPVTGGAFQTLNQGSYDAFVSKMDSQGTRILYSTYAGGEGSDQSSSIAVDANGVAYIAGFTYSSRFPLQSPVESATRGGQEAFAAAVGPTGSSLVWSTYLGGAGDDQATGIAVDPWGTAYIAGTTFSSDFPTTSGAYRTVYAGGDGFLVKLGTAAPVPVPIPVSVSPSSGIGTTQNFAFTASSVNGSADIASITVVLNSTLNGANACYFQYQVGGNVLSLANDTITTATSGTVGAVGTLANSQCELTLGASSATRTVNTLTLSVPVTFKAGLHGTQNIYMSTANTAGLASPSQQMGTWTVTTIVQPTVNLNPNAGAGSSQVFSAQYTNPGGAAAFTNAFILLNSSFAAARSCYVDYLPSSSGLYLMNDAGTGFLGPITSGSGATLQNGQCTLNASGSSATIMGNTLTLNASLTFTPAFAGAKTVFIFAYTGTANTGFQPGGTWTVTAGGAPTAGPLSPPSGVGASQVFGAQYTNPGGAATFTNAFVLLNSSFTAAGSCYVDYLPGSNGLFLMNDAGTSFLGPITPGSGATLQNNQCTLNSSGSSTTIVGNTLTLNASLTFTPAFAGAKTVFIFAFTGTANTGFQTGGTWTVTAWGAPTAGPLSPTSGAGASQVFSAQYMNPGGAAAFTNAFMLLNSSFTAAGSCYVDYLPGSNGLFLMNDAGTSFLGPITPGSGATLQNSQCTLNASGSSATIVGTTLMLNASLTFKPAFGGAKTVFIFSYTGTANTGFQSGGTWTSQ